MADARPVFLLGMMGAGKSSVGRLLAHRRGGSFIDLDVRIERMFAAAVAELFAAGESYFRACERTALRTLLAEPGFFGSAAVVATGGGVVVDRDNLAAMAAAGPTVYLEVPVEGLAARLRTAEQRQHRPLLAGDQPLDAQLAAILRARAAAYASAALTVDGAPEPARVVAAIEAGLARAAAGG